jgi:transposase-like protein
MRFTMSALAAALGIDAKTLRAWMAAQGVEPTPDRFDARRVTVSQDDAERLAAAHDRALGDVSDLPATLAAAHAEIVRLRGEILSLKTYNAPVTRHAPILTVLAPQVIDSSSYPPKRALSTALLLPDGLVSVEAFANRHGWPLQTIKKAITDGRLEETRGEWKMKRAIVKHALNLDQQIAMLALYRTHPRFQECDDLTCPCHI